METFVRTQEEPLDVVAEETSKVTAAKEPGRKAKKTELSELAKMPPMPSSTPRRK